MTIHYEFSNHAIERFRERFPSFDLVDSFERSVPVPARKIIDKAIRRGSRFRVELHDKFYHDVLSDCLFICKFHPENGSIIVITCSPWAVQGGRSLRVLSEFAAA